MKPPERRHGRTCTHGVAPGAACSACAYYRRVGRDVDARNRERARERRNDRKPRR